MVTLYKLGCVFWQQVEVDCTFNLALFSTIHLAGEGAYGLVLMFAGSAPVSAPSNVFICEQDKPYVDDSGKPLHTVHKPAALFSKLIDAYTGIGDWILDGTGGIGM